MGSPDDIPVVEIPLAGRHPSGRPFVAKTLLKPAPKKDSKFFQPTKEQLARPNDLREYAPPLKIEGIAHANTAQMYAVWGVPRVEFATSLQIEQAEGLILQRLQQLPAYKRNPERPLVAVINFFFEWKRTDTLDWATFQELIPKLGLAATPLIIPTNTWGLFQRMDLGRTGSFPVEEFAVRLFKPKGTDRGSTQALSDMAIVKNALSRCREGLYAKGGGFESFHNVLRQFLREYRENLSKIGLRANLRSFFRGYGCEFTEEEVDLLFDYFSARGGGEVIYTDFCDHVRGPMPPARLAMVKKAFASMGGRGCVTSDDVYAHYDGSKHQAVLNHVACPDDAVIWLLNAMDTQKEDVITLEEFCAAYEWTSASIASDASFEEMMRSVWPRAGL